MCEQWSAAYFYEKESRLLLMSEEKQELPHHLTLKNGIRLTLRQAEVRDAEQLLAFVEQIAGESENITFGPGEFHMSIDEERVFLQQNAEASGSLYLIAEVDNEIVGTLTFNVGKRLRLQHAGEFGISVVRAYWNSGIGSHMLAYLLSWARQKGTIRKINLRVRVDNLPAIHLYEKYGFIQEGRITREFYLHGAFIDSYVMGLQLD